MRRSGSSSGVGGLARAPRQVLAKATPARAARNGVAAVASVSAGADQPEGARRGGKEAAEVACADRNEGAGKDQAPQEDLARQVESGHACPAAFGMNRANWCVPWSALCAQPVAEGWTHAQGWARPADTRAIGGTRRGPRRRERVRPRPSARSSCPLDAWRTLRDESWGRYRHHFTTTE